MNLVTFTVQWKNQKKQKFHKMYVHKIGKYDYKSPNECKSSNSLHVNDKFNHCINAISFKYLTHFQPMFQLWGNQAVGFY